MPSSTATLRFKEELTVTNVHPLALVHPDAKLGSDVVVGPFSIIEAGVEVGPGCRLSSHVVLKTGTRVGARNEFSEGVTLGGIPQHKGVGERQGELVIGDENMIRENVTLHRAFNEGSVTTIGDRNLFMVNSHVGHDAAIGDDTILANNVMIGGHVNIGHGAIVSGGAGIHQFCRVGPYCMIGGLARVTQDVPPYLMLDGHSASAVGINRVGLKRNGFSVADIKEIKELYRLMFRSGLRWDEVMEELKGRDGHAQTYFEFLSQGKRGFINERRSPRSATVNMDTAQPRIAEETVRRAAG
ncbi:MAG: UDP-N-acetylglucosamine acyltransferase [Pirellulaceae bacterium]|jgi:UDP-N-acetylglucosamine acyltransferase